MTDSTNDGAANTRACRWLMLDPVARHLETTRDLAAGVACVLAMVNRVSADTEAAALDGAEYVPTLTPYEIGELMGMAAAVARGLAEAAGQMELWAWKYGVDVPGGGQGQA